MPRYQLAALNNQQVGAFAEYFVKMELTMYGFEVYTTEVDDRGIDFVARKARGPFIEVQVKALRGYGYVFMHKTKFELRANVFLALGLLFDDQAPRLFLIPATVWLKPDEVFVDRPYEGLKSKPEWGVNVSKKNCLSWNSSHTTKQSSSSPVSMRPLNKARRPRAPSHDWI